MTVETPSRRQFISLLIGSAVFVSRARAQAVVGDTAHGPTMSGPMDGSAYRPVRLPPKVDRAATLTQEQRNELEHKLKCQCGCVLDVYTCRTTDFTCPVSPAMHRDVLALVENGYDAPEILVAFQAVYGERVLMAPVKEGFNLLGYGLPFIAIAVGGISIFRWVRKRSMRPVAPVAAAPSTAPATAEEISQIEAAIRRDE